MVEGKGKEGKGRIPLQCALSNGMRSCLQIAFCSTWALDVIASMLFYVGQGRVFQALRQVISYIFIDHTLGIPSSYPIYLFDGLLHHTFFFDEDLDEHWRYGGCFSPSPLPPFLILTHIKCVVQCFTIIDYYYVSLFRLFTMFYNYRLFTPYIHPRSIYATYFSTIRRALNYLSAKQQQQ